MTETPLTERQIRVLVALDELAPRGRESVGVPGRQIAARLDLSVEQVRGTLRNLWGANLVATGHPDWRGRTYWPRHDDAAISIRARRGMTNDVEIVDRATCNLCHRPIERRVPLGDGAPTRWQHSGKWNPRHLATPIGVVNSTATRTEAP